MLPRAFTGSGASVLLTLSTGADVTVVVASGPVCGSDSLLSIVHPVLVITVPFARGLFTLTTSCTDPDTPAFTAPRLHVRTPPASVPPPAAATTVVFAGSGSWSTPPVALFVPTFWSPRV